MGIVVTLFMLLALLMVSPLKWLSFGQLKSNQGLASFIGVGLLLTGLWNALWHGLRYLHDFWGIAALVSGIFMVTVAIIILNRHASTMVTKLPAITSAYKLINPLSALCILGLFLSFMLYAITLIRLNLGLPII